MRFALQHGLILTVVIAAVARLFHWVAVLRHDPFYAKSPPHFDMHTYCAWACSIAAGDWLSAQFTGGEPFFYGPVYSYFLGALFALFGENYHLVHLLQAAIGVATCALIWYLGRLLFGEAPALAAGILAAVCAPWLFYEQILLMEGLLVFIHAALLVCVVRSAAAGEHSWRWWAAVGLLAGLATLARSNFLLLVPLLALGAVLFSRAVDKETWAARARIRAQKSVGALLLGAFLVLGLSLIRNVYVSGKWVLTTSNGPMNLYIGNAPDSAGILQLPPSFLVLKEKYGSESAVPWSEELSRAISQDPAAPIRLFFRKLWIFWNGYDVADNVSYYLNQRYSPLVRWSPSTWLLLVPIAAIGAWSRRREWAVQWPLYIYAFAFPVSIALVFVLGRYRLPVLIPLLLWSGVAVSAWTQMAAARQWKSLVGSLPILGIGLLLLCPKFSPAVGSLQGPSGQRHLIRANEYNNLAQGQIESGRLHAAREVLEEGIRFYPDAPELISKLIDIYARNGEHERAVRLLTAYLERNGPAPVPLMRLAQIHSETGNRSAALRALDQVLQIAPGHAGAADLRRALQSSE